MSGRPPTEQTDDGWDDRSDEDGEAEGEAHDDGYAEDITDREQDQPYPPDPDRK